MVKLKTRSRTKTVVISTRVSEVLVKYINLYFETGIYVSFADFLRDAIREKLERDMPNLYEEIFSRRKT